MAGRKKTTFAKLNREANQREKRVAKQARKEARKLASANGVDPAADESRPEPDPATVAPSSAD